MEQSVRARRLHRAPRAAPCRLQDAVVPDLHAVEGRSQAPTEVLDRDQRTVRSLPVEDSRTWAAAPRRQRRVARPPTAAAPACPCDQCQVLVCDPHHQVRVLQSRICRRQPSSSPSSPSSSRSRPSSSWFPVGSVIRWFLAALCVLALLPPPAMAAPTPTRSQPKWINPCGLNKQVGEQDLEYQGEQATSVGDLLQRIVTLSKIALEKTVKFREAYVKETFQKDYDDHHGSWKEQKFDWLPNLPKRLGEQVSDSHLHKQSLEVALKDIYKYLQQYAVGLEQVVLDQKANGDNYRGDFEYVENQLRNVLCEVQVAMQEQGVVQHPDVTADIMGPSFRDPKMSSTYRNVRDWIILREYMNGLEYVVQMLEFLGRPQQ